jgi:hypothetical protein
MSCLGIDNIAARENTMMPIPQVEKTAVVTKDLFYKYSVGREKSNSQCPGIALSLAISAILKPPSLTTLAKQA